jgi:BA14K-like protein
MRYKFLGPPAVAVLAGLLSWDGAQASVMTSSVPVRITDTQNANIQPAKYKYWYHGGNWGHHHGGHHHHNNNWGPWLGIGLLPFFGGYGGYYGGYGGYYGGYGGGHVSWCINHYRTYDIRTDTFIGYDGYRHRCRGPGYYGYY